MSCLATADECICQLDESHDGPHECSCGGKWERRDGKFVVVKFPGEAGERFGGDVARAITVGIFGFRDDEDDE